MRPTATPIALLSACALLLSGCADPDPASSGDGGGPQDRPFEDASVAPAVPQHVRAPPTTLNLTGAQRLVEEEAGAGKVTLNFGPGAFVQGGTPTVVEGPQWPYDVQIRSIRIDGHVGTDTPVVASQIADEVIVWLGVDGHLWTSLFINAPDVLMPGDAAPFSADIPLGRGLVVPAGSRLTMALGTFYADDGSVRSTHILTGPETGTTLTMQAEWTHLPPVAEATEVYAGTGKVSGSACAGTASGMESTGVTFEVAEGTAYIEAHLSVAASTNGGNDDLDVQVIDAAGNAVGRTTAPVGTESLMLWAPQIEGAAYGTWTAIVTTCALQDATFGLRVLAAQAEAAAKATAAAPSV